MRYIGFEPEEWQKIMNILSKQPYKDVYPLIHGIQQQFQQNLTSAASAPSAGSEQVAQQPTENTDG